MSASRMAARRAGRDLRSRAFITYAGGYAAAILGDEVWLIDLAWTATQLGSPTQAGLVVTFGAAPRAVLLLAGGVTADRHDIGRVAAFSQLLRIGLMAGAGVAFLVTSARIWELGILALLLGVADAFYVPAASALPKRIVDERTLPSAQGALQTIQRACTIAAGPLAGLLMATGSMTPICLFNVAACTGALCAFRHLHSGERRAAAPSPSDPSGGGLLTTIGAGLGYIAGEPTLRWVVPAVTVLNVALAAPFGVGLALLSNHNGWGTNGLSLLYTAFGVAAFLGSAVVAARQWAQPTTLGLVTAVLAGLFTGLLATTHELPLAAAALAGIGISLGPAGALLVGDIQRLTNQAFIGRVTSILTLGSLGLGPLTYGLFGLLTQAVGLTPAFLACGASASLSALVAAIGVQRAPKKHT